MLKDKPPIRESNLEGKAGQVNKDGERHISERSLDASIYSQYTGREKSGNAFNDNELDPNKHQASTGAK